MAQAVMIPRDLAAKWLDLPEDHWQEDIDATLLWWLAYMRSRPIRSLALEDGYELPEMKLSDWASLHKHCFVCGKQQVSGFELMRLHVHHISRRPHCHKPHRDRIENLFRACGPCHENKLATMPHAKQIAYKWRQDRAGHATLPEFLDRFLRVGDPDLRAPNRVTVSEVLTEMEIIADAE